MRHTPLLIAAVLAWLAPAAPADDWQPQRAQMLREIADDARRTADYIHKRALDERVLAAIGQVPRHAFVPPGQRGRAYHNTPLPIGHGQTISQPYIVALMTDLVAPQPSHRVLEIGTGSGYQAAVLSRLVAWVYTVEIIPTRAGAARARLAELGYGNISSRTGDGYYGWEAHGPFDAIVVTAAADNIPPPLIRQLKPGGRLVMPVGDRFSAQQLVLLEKDAEGAISLRQLLPVIFVPLTGDH